ncbi:uncharacterized protein LOC142222337 [Haematobia irritans]|uniref:uncharacterized protein LOC142222337 n=1 Tax=Haematobia irritans TaxID=7368 RepID=UPI003F4FF550
MDNINDNSDDNGECSACGQTQDPDNGNSFPLMELANTTFRELCQSLECEQIKLMDLEQRRKKLQEEMLLLKAEIEKEKQLYESNLVQSVSHNLKVLNNDIGEESKTDEEDISECRTVRATPSTVDESRTDTANIEKEANQIKEELQNILEECVFEQNQANDS